MVQGNDWSNVGKLIFKSSIRFLGSGQGLIECWKGRFQEFDSFSWFRATTDRALESSFSRVRFVFLVQGNDWSNVGKLIFKSSIRFLGSGQRLIERWKAHFQEFDSFLGSGQRLIECWKLIFKSSIHLLVQGNDWSNVGKLVFKSSIRLLGSGQGLIECWKARFQEFDSFSWFRATTDRMLESSFSRVRLVYSQSLPWTKKTNRILENELSNIRSVLALNQVNESNSWKRAFQHSISRCPEQSKLIELLKTSFPTFDQSLPWTKKTNRTLENEFSNIRWFRATTDRMLESSFSRVRFVFLVQGNDWSNVGKLIFKSSIRFLGSGQGLIECWKARFQEFDSFSWFRARTDRMLESSFSRVRFVFLVQGNNWSNVGKLVFKSSIRFLQSLPWTKKTNRTLENELSNIRSVIALNQVNESNSWKWAFQHSISRCPEPRKRIELLKTSFPTFDQLLPWTKKTNRTLENELSNIRSVLALNQENESNSWKRAFQHSISPCPEPRKRIELLKMSFPTFDQSLPWTKKTNRTLENELSNIRSVVALNQENESNSWKRAFQRSISRCPEPSKWIELLKMSFPTFDQSLPWTKKTNRTLENELSNTRSVVALNQENESNSWKLSFPTFDQSLPWTKKTNRTLENEFSNIRWFRATTDRMLESSFSRVRFVLMFRATTDRMLESSFSRVRFVFLVQGNDWSNVGKLIFKSSIRFLGSGQWLTECWKARFQEFD